jgi:RND family efflux transporter MFP subunit
MPLSKKAAALASGLVAVLSAATVAQQPPPQARPETISVAEASIEVIDSSEVAALREGVLDKMELEEGDEVKAGGTIGHLHHEVADLTVAKAKVAAENVGAIEKAEAQKALAVAVLARDHRLLRFANNQVSQEDIQKHEAELHVAEAMRTEAIENQKLAQAELKLAERAAKEHEIVAPFDGTIVKQIKHPGESVRANEPVVRLVSIDRLRVIADVPVESAYKIKVGDLVEVTPNIAGAILDIEKTKFRGKITHVDPDVNPGSAVVKIFAEIPNKDHALRTGFKADMVIFLNTAGQDPEVNPVAAQARR